MFLLQILKPFSKDFIHKTFKATLETINTKPLNNNKKRFFVN